MCVAQKRAAEAPSGGAHSPANRDPCPGPRPGAAHGLAAGPGPPSPRVPTARPGEPWSPAGLPPCPSSRPWNLGTQKVTSFKEEKQEGGSWCVCTLGVCPELFGLTCCRVYTVASKSCLKNSPLWCELTLCFQRVKKKTPKRLFMVLLGDV